MRAPPLHPGPNTQAPAAALLYPVTCASLTRQCSQRRLSILFRLHLAPVRAADADEAGASDASTRGERVAWDRPRTAGMRKRINRLFNTMKKMSSVGVSI